MEPNSPSTKESRSHSLVEGSELLTEVSEDLLINANLLSSSASAHLHVPFESAANRQEILADEYRKLLRGLNIKQRQIVMFHRNWCKKAVMALKQGNQLCLIECS